MKSKTLTEIIAVLLILLVTSVAFSMPDVSPNNFPRMDDYYQYECADEEDMINKATTGVIDSAIDVRNPDNVYMMNTTYGWTTTTTGGYSPHITNFNARDVYPSTANEKYDYHGRMPGDSNFPLNVSAFRFAIKILWSRPKMDEWVSEIFDWTEEALMTCVTPAHGKWYNLGLDATLETYDTARALEVLNTAGFYNDSAHTGQTDGEWWNTNPAIGPLVELRPIYVMCCIEAITSTAAISQKQYQSLADFFNIHKQYIFDESLAWTFTPLIYITYWDRTFDLVSHGWVLGKNPDYIYDFYHPSMDLVYGDNGPGWVPDDPLIADKMFALKYWRWPNGTYITDEQKMVDICWELQEDIYYASPVSYNYVTVQTSCYHPDLADVINTAGYGSDIWLTYMYNYYSGDLTKTAINYANPGPISTLNTGWLSSYYDHEPYDLLNDFLWVTEPSGDHNDVMWGCLNWSTQEWVDLGLGVQYGQKVTFKIRPGINWHNGDECTAEDVAFNYRTMKKLHLAQYADIESTLVYSNVVDKYTIEVYMNCTGVWYIYTYAGLAFIFNENVWRHWWERVDAVGEAVAIAEAEAWQPWLENYDTWTGESGHGALTCLVGTGPYIFVEWDRIAGVTHVTRNPNYWKTAQVVASVNAPTFVPATNPAPSVSFSINFENLDWWGTRSYTVNSVTLDGTPVIGAPTSGSLSNFTTTTTGTFLTGPLTNATHHIVVTVTTDATGKTYTADHVIYVTVAEDVNRDIKVRVDDVLTAANAFGTNPGNLRWEYMADINHDHKVRVDDILAIAMKFGWTG